MSASYDAISRLHAAVKDAVSDAPISDVLAVLLGHLVGITAELARRRGQDIALPILIDGGQSRDITIHPPKSAQYASAAKSGATLTDSAHLEAK